MDVVTVCADTVDFGLDASVSSTSDDDVDGSVPEVSRSDAGSASSSASSSSSLAADGPFAPCELDEDDEFAPEDSEFDDEESELDDDDPEELDCPSSAAAIPGLLAIAAPIPRATARPPTLPMKRP
jgi:hypothetical protein